MGERQRQPVQSTERTLRELERTNARETRDNLGQHIYASGGADDIQSEYSRESVFITDQYMDIDAELSHLQERIEQNRQGLNTSEVDRKRIGAIVDEEEKGRSRDEQKGKQQFNIESMKDTSYSQQKDYRFPEYGVQGVQGAGYRNGSFIEGERFIDSHPLQSGVEDRLQASRQREHDRGLEKDKYDIQKRTDVLKESEKSVDNMEKVLDKEVKDLDEYLRRLKTGEYDRERQQSDGVSRRQ